MCEHAFETLRPDRSWADHWRRMMRARAALLLLSAVVALLLLVPGVARALAGPGEEPSVIYVVQPGDTLWQIARRADPGGDPRPLVDRLAEGDDVRDGLHPGDRLRLPAGLGAHLGTHTDE
jgi:hypothetical protein